MRKSRELLAVLALLLCYVAPMAAGARPQFFPPTQSNPPQALRNVAKRAPGNTGTCLLVPAYIYPSTAAVWAPLVTAKGLNESACIVAIINPASGPGTTTDPNYTAMIAQLLAAGIKCYGYVDTAQGADTIPSVEANVLLWTSLYSGITGIFFDDQNNTSAYESYYTTLTAYSHSLGFLNVIGNPGTETIAGLVGALDVQVIYEGSAAPTVSYVSVGTSPLFRQDYNKRNFAAIAYGVSSFVLATFQALVNYVGYIYFCNNSSYGAIPTYINNEVNAL